MRSTSAITTIALILAASPAFAAPLSYSPDAQSSELDARAGVPLGLLKALGKGAATGGLFAGLEDIFGGDSSNNQTSKRELSSEEINMLKREIDALAARASIPLGILKSLGEGAATGALFTGLTDLIDGGGSNSQNSQTSKRGVSSDELSALVARASIPLGILKSLGGGAATGALFTGLEDIFGGESSNSQTSRRDLHSRGLGGFGATIGEGIAGGIGSALAGTAITDLINKIENRGLGGLGATIGEGIAGGVGSAVAGTAITDLIQKIENGQLKSREVNELMARAGLASGLESLATKFIGNDGDLGDIITNAIIGGAASGAAKQATDSALNSRGLGGLAGSLGKDLAGGVGSALAGTALNQLLSNTNLGDLFRRELADLAAREPFSLGPIGKGLIGTGVGIGASDLTSDGISALESLFNRSVEIDAREPFSLGPIGKGLVGTAVGIGASDLTSDGISALENLFNRSVEIDAREPFSLGPIGKGLVGTAVGIGASDLTSDGIEALQNLFNRTTELD